jgi:hypothetical protein
MQVEGNRGTMEMARIERRPEAFRQAESLAELMNLADEDFIYCAFWTMLGRGADPEGYTYYIARLRRGISKASILHQMRKSKEGQLHGADLTGLREMLRRYRLGRMPVLGFLFRWFYKIEGDSPTERLVRSIENRVHALDYAIDQLLPKVDRLSSRASDGPHAGRRISARGHRAGTSLSAPSGELTPRTRRAYEQLVSEVGRLSS